MIFSKTIDSWIAYNEINVIKCRKKICKQKTKTSNNSIKAVNLTILKIKIKHFFLMQLIRI